VAPSPTLFVLIFASLFVARVTVDQRDQQHCSHANRDDKHRKLTQFDDEFYRFLHLATLTSDGLVRGPKLDSSTQPSSSIIMGTQPAPLIDSRNLD
jgi:hypothetical protein